MSAEKATKKRRRGSAGAVSQTANVDNDMLPYLSSVPAETALQGIIDDKSRWQQTADGGYFYGDLARTFVAISDPRSQPTADQQAATFNRILELDDSAAQTFLYVMARDLARAADAPKSRLTSMNSLSSRATNGTRRAISSRKQSGMNNGVWFSFLTSGSPLTTRFKCKPVRG